MELLASARYRELKDIRWDVYVPYGQFSFPVRYVTVRTSFDPSTLVATVRREVAALDPNQAVTSVATMEQLFSNALARPRFNALLLGLLSVLAVTLAAVGLYGVVSYSVSARTNEIGVRMALGARGRDVLSLVVKQGMILVLVGIAVGLAASLILTRLLASLLFGVSATDPLTFLVIPLALMTVGLLACIIPARRATRVDPMVALRYE
ncbi:MAG: FtsX-like permease family protein [Pyrinomonadaceae bacterium]